MKFKELKSSHWKVSHFFEKLNSDVFFCSNENIVTNFYKVVTPKFFFQILIFIWKLINQNLPPLGYN